MDQWIYFAMFIWYFDLVTVSSHALCLNPLLSQVISCRTNEVLCIALLTALPWTVEHVLVVTKDIAKTRYLSEQFDFVSSMYSQKRCSAEEKKKKRVIRESASDKGNAERFHVEKDVSDANNASCRRLPPVLLYKFLKMDLVHQGSLYPRVLHDLKLQRLSEDHPV